MLNDQFGPLTVQGAERDIGCGARDGGAEARKKPVERSVIYLTGSIAASQTLTTMEAGPDLSSLKANTRDWGAITDPVRLLIADHAPTRVGIKMALGPEVTVCAEAGEIGEAIRAAERGRPRVVLLGRGLCADVTFAVGAICRVAPDSAVVVLAPSGDVDDMLDAVRAGAVGYVPGALGADRLRRVLWSVIADEAVVPRAMVTDLLSELRGPKTNGSLTERETQVLGMLRRGHATAAIAARLQIAPVTVRRHVSELVHKLGVDGRADLVTHVDG